MAEFIQCRWCEDCDTNRKNGDKVRCKKYSQWVDPCSYGIKGCKNYGYYQNCGAKAGEGFVTGFQGLKNNPEIKKISEAINATMDGGKSG